MYTAEFPDRPVTSQDEAALIARSIIAEAVDPDAAVEALRTAGLLATHQERGTSCGYSDCHPAHEPVTPCSWVDAGDNLLVLPGHRVFTRFTGQWIEEIPAQ